jgi:hypothetical protein
MEPNKSTTMADEVTEFVVKAWRMCADVDSTAKRLAYDYPPIAWPVAIARDGGGPRHPTLGSQMRAKFAPRASIGVTSGHLAMVTKETRCPDFQE